MRDCQTLIPGKWMNSNYAWSTLELSYWKALKPRSNGIRVFQCCWQRIDFSKLQRNLFLSLLQC